MDGISRFHGQHRQNQQKQRFHSRSREGFKINASMTKTYQLYFLLYDKFDVQGHSFS